MAFDGIVTKCIVNDLNNYLINSKVNKFFEPTKNEIIISLGQRLRCPLRQNSYKKLMQ